VGSGDRPEPTRSPDRAGRTPPGNPARRGGSDPIRDFFAQLAGRYTLDADRRPGAAAADPAHTHGEAVIDELVRAMLQWEAGHAQARAAYHRLLGAVTDYNELRICFPRELADLLGPRYPLVGERCERLCAALNDIAAREQSLSLERLRTLNKREIRRYVSAVHGLPRFVVSRVMLFGFGAHAFPLDARLLKGMVGAGLFENGTEPEAAAGRIERSVRAGEAADAYDSLELWSAGDETGAAGDHQPPSRKHGVAPKSSGPRANR